MVRPEAEPRTTPPQPATAYNIGSEHMMADEKEKIETAAVTGVGAGVGGYGGATVGVLELAATTGNVTGISASVVIGAGAAVGALAFFLGYKAYRYLKNRKPELPKAG